jgi:GntR family transcriptional regulator
MAPAVPLPKYHQVYLVLREQLAEGRFRAGVPAEMRLMQQFGVARATVRKALERLAAEGLIERRPGRGTVPRTNQTVAASAVAPKQGQLVGLLENIVHMSLQTRVNVLSCATTTASPLVARRLALTARARVQKAVRVRITQDGPLSHITTWVPLQLAKGFGRRELAREPILLLLEQAGVRIGRATQSISACSADEAVAHALAVPVGTALLAVERLVYDTDERPVQWLQGLYRPDRYQYEMQLSRVGGIAAKVWVSTELPAQFH